MQLATGQCWTYRAPEGFEMSRIVIGAIAKFEGGQDIICCAVSEAPRRNQDGTTERVTIPFLPMSEAAFRASVISLEGESALPADFAQKLEEWSRDPKGMTAFTVPFEGFVDKLIAKQMEQIAGIAAA